MLGAAELSLDTPDAELSQQLGQLESEAESETAKRWLEQLSQYEERTLQAHPEHPALDLPRYALAARADALLRRWQEQRAFQTMQITPARLSKAPASKVERRARIRWIAQASTQQLDEFRGSVASAVLPEMVLLALATKQNKHADAMELAHRGLSRAALDHLRKHFLAPTTTPEQSQALLDGMRSNPSYRGAVASLNTAWLQQHPKHLQVFLQNWPQQTWSQELLDTVVLLGPANLLEQLQSALYNSANSDTATLAAWGLWQLQTPDALQVLASYVQSPAAIPQLRQELGLWLR